MNWTIYGLECLAVIILFTCAIMVPLAGADSFKSAFLASYGIWLLVDWYDCFFLGWVLFCALGGSGFLAYIIAAIVIPENPE